MQDLPKEVIQTARGIASHPEDFLSDTTVFTTAWAALKAERGQSFDPSRLRPQHIVDCPPPTPEPIDQTLDRVAERVRDLIATKGYCGLPPHAA
ncbi:hypothetical protein [Pseudophaeobacter arcticus]|jgi:hypothetical protein|uniref:hypothetical protein n=1 Tax=Pseudophaeobacter arcticus TaxID=385492 RepID=UPI0039E656AC